MTGNVLVAESGDEDFGIDVNAGTADARIVDNEIGAAGAGFAIGVRMRQTATGAIEDNSILGTRQDGWHPRQGDPARRDR